MDQRQTVIKMLVRMPADAKAWLEAEAQRNLSSQASEVVRSVRDRMDRERHAFAFIAPLEMPLRIGGKLNPKAIAVYNAAFNRKWIV